MGTTALSGAPVPDREELARYWNSGMTYDEMGKKFGYSLAGIRAYGLRIGLPPRPVNGGFDKAKFVADYMGGVDLRVIAAGDGVTVEAIRSRAARIKLPPRPVTVTAQGEEPSPGAAANGIGGAPFDITHTSKTHAEALAREAEIARLDAEDIALVEIAARKLAAVLREVRALWGRDHAPWKRAALIRGIDKGWITLAGDPMSLLDLRVFSVTPEGYRAAGLKPPPFSGGAVTGRSARA